MAAVRHAGVSRAAPPSPEAHGDAGDVLRAPVSLHQLLGGPCDAPHALRRSGKSDLHLSEEVQVPDCMDISLFLLISESVCEEGL